MFCQKHAINIIEPDQNMFLLGDMQSYKWGETERERERNTNLYLLKSGPKTFIKSTQFSNWNPFEMECEKKSHWADTHSTHIRHMHKPCLYFSPRLNLIRFIQIFYNVPLLNMLYCNEDTQIQLSRARQTHTHTHKRPIHSEIINRLSKYDDGLKSMPSMFCMAYIVSDRVDIRCVVWV